MKKGDQADVPEWLDTHAHLSVREFAADRVEVLRRAAAAGVSTVLEVAVGPADWDAVLETVASAAGMEEAPRTAAALGVHPHEAGGWGGAVLDSLAEKIGAALAAGVPVAAVGEIGLDYFRDYTPREAQRAAFRAQLRLADELNLPVVVHSRAATEDVLAELEEERARRGRALRGVMHCFSDGPETARRATALGLHLGFGGVLTYPKADETRAAAASVPTERLLLETDCPYLPPQSRRGKRNEPAFLPESGRRLAEVLERSVEEVAALTTANARELFFSTKGTEKAA